MSMNQILTKRKLSGLWLSIASVLFCAFMIWGISSSWGNVSISRVVYTGIDGVNNSYLMYIPKSATADTPAPAALVVQGGSSTAHRFDSFSTELARRGFVVIAVDKSGAGFSELVDEKSLLQNMVDYLQSLKIVQPDKLHLIGHSGGTWAVSQLAANNVGKIASVCFCHTSTNALPRFASDVGTNFYFILSKADFGLFDTEATDKYLSQWFDTSTVEYGKIYGSFENNDAHMLYWDHKPIIHAAATWSPEVISTFLNFIGNISPESASIDTTRQVWQWTVVFGLLGMGATIWFLLALVMELIKQPFFATIKRPLSKELGFKGGKWALSAVLSIGGGVLLYFVREKCFGSSENAFFNSSGLNMLTPYLIIFALYELLLFTLLFLLPFRRTEALGVYEIGLSWGEGKKNDFVQLGKCALLAIIVEASIFSLFHALEFLGGISFQFLFVSFNAIPLARIFNSLGYVILFVFLFFSANFGQNITRRLKSTGDERKDIAIAIVLNALIAAAPTAILALMQVVAHHHLTELLNMNYRHMYGAPFMFGFAGAINTYLHRKTGIAWLGILVNALFIGIFAASAQPYDMNFLDL